jgi:uracil-DNA glycosylase
MEALSPFLDTSAVDEAWTDLFHEIPVHACQAVAAKLGAEHGVRALPPRQLRLHCFRFFHPAQTRVVLLGTEPSPSLDDSVGLSFSVSGGGELPTHLKMIFKELRDDVGQVRTPRSGNLTWWAQQGVLLLNSSLTVAEGQPGSHVLAWYEWTVHFLKRFSKEYPGVVYILWGDHAQSFVPHIDTSANVIITGVFPTTANRFKFLGQQYFSRTNAALEFFGKSPINWLLQ